MKKGSRLLSFAGTKVVVDSVFNFRTDTATTVYNLEVKGNENYYVSASKVLVHNCNIENYKIPLTKEKHRIKPEGIHTINGGNWNKVWREFFKNNPNPTQKQIKKQLKKMRKDFGI